MSTPSARLRAKIEMVLPVFWTATQRMWSREDVREIYPHYLVVMHQMVRATVPLMVCAERVCRESYAADPVAELFASYLRKHQREEHGHDRWVAEDLRTVSAGTEALLAQMPPAAIANCVGAQYYWLQHHHPISLLGHIAVLEGYPPAPTLSTRLASMTGFPREAFRTLEKHSVIDQFHSREIFALIDSLPLESSHEQAIGLSAMHTVASLLPIFDELSSAPVGRFGSPSRGR